MTEMNLDDVKAELRHFYADQVGVMYRNTPEDLKSLFYFYDGEGKERQMARFGKDLIEAIELLRGTIEKKPCDGKCGSKACDVLGCWKTRTRKMPSIIAPRERPVTIKMKAR